MHVIAAPAASVAGLAGVQDNALTVPRFTLGTQVGLVAGEPPVLVQTSVKPLNAWPGATAAGTSVNAGLILATTTVVLAVALLLPGFGSADGDVTVAVLLITVPAAVAGATVTTRVKTELPTGRVPMVEQLIVPLEPTAGLVQVQPAGVTSEAKVVPAGRVSVIAAEAATVGPALDTVMLYVTVLPAPTGSGLSVIVTDRSALAVTVVVAVALLLPRFVSGVGEPTETVFVTTVPFATAAPTLTTRANVEVPTAIVPGTEQLNAPVPPATGAVQNHPGDVIETMVVFAGIEPDTSGATALLGPALVTTNVYVKSLPAKTGSAESDSVTLRSANVFTLVVAVALLLAALLSPVADVTATVFDNGRAIVGATATDSTNVALPTGKFAFVQDTVPPLPTAGVVHDQPATTGSETKAVPAGSVSDHDTELAASGPLLVTVMVYVRLLPAVTGSGVSTLVMARSAT